MSDKLKGLIYGCALGDAFGVQYEGCDKQYISERHQSHSDITFKTEGAWHGVSLSDWTDDTDQLILILEVLTENGNVFDPKLFAKKLHNWRWHGFKELGDLCGMGVGQLTAKIISDPEFLTDPINTSLKVYKELGSNRAPNGALMRAGISAFATDWDKTAILQAKTTHADARCVISSLVLTYICRMFIVGKTPSKKVIKSLLTDYPFWGLSLPELKLDAEDRGYTYKTLACGLYVLDLILKKEKIDFIDIMQQITFEGGDTDTNCAVAGQILGSYLGYNKLPVDWLNKLKHKD